MLISKIHFWLVKKQVLEVLVTCQLRTCLLHTLLSPQKNKAARLILLPKCPTHGKRQQLPLPTTPQRGNPSSTSKRSPHSMPQNCSGNGSSDMASQIILNQGRRLTQCSAAWRLAGHKGLLKLNKPPHSAHTCAGTHTQTLFFFVPAEDSSCCSSNAALPYVHMRHALGF